MNPQLKNRINRMLGQRGLAQLDEAGLVSQLGFLVRDHDHFLSLLIACEPSERRHMYDALVLNLRFKARPLEEYVSEARADAEARRLPVQEPDGSLKEFKVPEIKTTGE